MNNETTHTHTHTPRKPEIQNLEGLKETKAKIFMPKVFQENQKQMTNWEKKSITHIISYYHISSHYFSNSY